MQKINQNLNNLVVVYRECATHFGVSLYRMLSSIRTHLQSKEQCITVARRH